MATNSSLSFLSLLLLFLSSNTIFISSALDTNQLKDLHVVNIPHANLTGFLPKTWPLNLTYVDLSGNQLQGKIPLSLSSIPGLVHLDLGSNQLHGTIPKFISDMKDLKYLNLERNNFHGVLPFNDSFIKKLVVFKVGGNANLCYHHSAFLDRMELGIAPCGKHGRLLRMKISVSDKKADDDDSADKTPPPVHEHGPSRVVLGVAIGLSSIVFLIIFLVLLSKCCK